MEQQPRVRRRVTVQMVFAALLLGYNIATFYGCDLPNLADPTANLIVLTVLFSAASLLLVISALGTICIDPHYRPTPSTSFSSRRKKSEHDVLAFCKKCQREFQPTTKHCRECDHCTDGFDHHCKWIGRCIGRRNFKWFLWMIGSCFAHLTLYIAAGMVMALKWREQRRVEVAIVGTGMVMSAVMACLNLYLIGYQIVECVKERSLTTINRQSESLAKIYPTSKGAELDAPSPGLPNNRELQRNRRMTPQNTEPEDASPRQQEEKMEQLPIPTTFELKNSSNLITNKSEQNNIEELDRRTELSPKEYEPA